MKPSSNPARLLSAAELALFTRVSNGRAALSVLHTWAVIAATLAVAVWFWSWPVALVAVVIIATQQHALFLLSHDAAHYRLFEHRGTNELVGRLCATAAGLSMCSYRIIHRMHHSDLYGPNDPDMALHGGYPRGKWYLVRKLLKDLSGLTAVKTYAYFFGAPATQTASGKRIDPLADTPQSLQRAARTDRSMVVLVHLALPALIVALGGWRALGFYSVLWVLPACTVLQAILRLRAICEHGAAADTSSPFTAARTHRLGSDARQWLARLLLFPHHVNYHIEHHLCPAAPHYRLPALHAALKQRGWLQRAEVGSISTTFTKIFAERCCGRPEQVGCPGRRHCDL